MSEVRRRRGKPIWKRGRVGRYLGGLWDYTRTAWWGVVSARVTESRQLVIAQAVIVRDEPCRQVLLSIRSDLFGWELPGGTLEGKESPADAVVREVREETGLEIDPFEVVGVWVRRGFRPHTAHVFLAHVIAGTEIPSHETPRLKWFDVDDLPEALFSWYEAPLREALAPGHDLFVGDEWQGVHAIWQAMKIDLAMRWKGLPDSDDE